jgi:hypothetical protein
MTTEATASSTAERLRAAARVIALDLRAFVAFPLGVIGYWLSGKTAGASYQSFVWLSCVTGGRLNDLLSAALARLRPKIPLGAATGVLGELSVADVQNHARRLRQDGFVLFPAALPAAACDRLTQFALQTPASVRRMDHEPVSSAKRTALFNADAPLGVRYDYDTSALLNNPDIQALLADRALISIAQEYLGSRPVMDVLSMWWHTNYHAQPDSQAAQYFHFDMDRIKWLKVFVYLTDVGPDNGPHMFIKGSHRSGAIPASFLRRGYARLMDDEVFRQYPPERRVQFCAPRGSIIIEDTRGLHKGVNVCGAARLMLQMQFSNSLFGINAPRSRFVTVRDSALQGMLQRAPSIYRQYL